MRQFWQKAFVIGMVMQFLASQCDANFGWGVYNPNSMANIQRSATFTANGIADLSSVAITVKFVDTTTGIKEDEKSGTSGADGFGSWTFDFNPNTASGAEK